MNKIQLSEDKIYWREDNYHIIASMTKTMELTEQEFRRLIAMNVKKVSGKNEDGN